MTIHPMLVHFPIALWVSAFLFEAGHLILKKDSLHRTAIQIFWMAVCLTPLVVWTGLLEEQKYHLNHPVLTQHKTYAFCLLWGSLASAPILLWLSRKSVKIFKIVFLACTLVATIGVILTGYYGGKLVFEYAIGVEQ